MPDKIEIDLDYQAHTITMQTLIEQCPHYEHNSNLCAKAETEEQKKVDYELHAKHKNKVFNMLMTVDLTEGADTLDSILVLEEVEDALSDSTIINIDSLGQDPMALTQSIAHTPAYWLEITSETDTRSSALCSKRSVEEVQKSQKHTLLHFNKAMLKVQQGLCNTHNHMSVVGSPQDGYINFSYIYTNMAYGALRRIPRNKYKHITLCLKSLNSSVYERDEDKLRITSPEIVMAYTKPRAIAKLRKQCQHPQRYMFCIAHPAIAFKRSLFNYSLYNEEDIDVAFFIRFSSSVHFRDVIEQELQSVQQTLDIQYANDTGVKHTIRKARVAVYQNDQGSNMSFIIDDASELSRTTYSNILQRLNNIYNTVHYMGLNAFFSTDGVEKVVVHLRNDKVPNSLASLCYITAFEDIYNSTLYTYNQAKQYVSNIPNSISTSYICQFMHAIHSPFGLMREVVRLALSAPCSILHKYACHVQTLSVHPLHVCAQAALAQAYHKCDECPRLYMQLHASRDTQATIHDAVNLAVSLMYTNTQLFGDAHTKFTCNVRIMMHKHMITAENYGAADTSERLYGCLREHLTSATGQFIEKIEQLIGTPNPSKQNVVSNEQLKTTIKVTQTNMACASIYELIARDLLNKHMLVIVTDAAFKKSNEITEHKEKETAQLNAMINTAVQQECAHNVYTTHSS